MKTIRGVLIGVGNLGRRLCEVLQDKEELLRTRYDLEFKLVGAADSRGAAVAPEGLDLAELVRLKLDGRSVGEMAHVGRPGLSAPELVRQVTADVLLEASPVNLAQRAEPGISCIRTALRKRMHVVTPNKGPLVLAYRELHDLARENGVQLRFDGTVAGGLPVLYLGMRDLRGATIYSVEAVLNLVTGYVLELLADGLPWEEALATAREEGVLEADPAWDVEGWDAAAKLTILANAALHYPATLDDVHRSGITELETEELVAARKRGYHYRLLARAERRGDGSYSLSVAPVPLPPEHPFNRLGRKQLGATFVTDIYGTLTELIDEPTPVPSAATMLRDLLDIYTN